MEKIIQTRDNIQTTRNTQPEQWPVCLSACLLPSLDEAELTQCSAAGIDGLEILLFRHGMETLSLTDIGVFCTSLKQRLQNAGLKAASIHLPFGWEWDVSDLDRSSRQKIIQNQIGLIEQAAVLEPQQAVIHPSYEPLDGAQRPDRILACRESLEILAASSARMGIRIAAECLPRTCLGNTAGEIMMLVDGLANVSICCDVNHLLQETPQDFIRQVGSRITTTHISDYDNINERHWLPGLGIIDWPEVISALSATGYEGPFLYEVSQVNGTITPAVIAGNWRDLQAAWLQRSKK